MTKLLNWIRRSPAADWTIADIAALCAHHHVVCDPPRRWRVALKDCATRPSCQAAYFHYTGRGDDLFWGPDKVYERS